jgi:hypothetical protein
MSIKFIMYDSEEGLVLKRGTAVESSHESANLRTSICPHCRSEYTELGTELLQNLESEWAALT